MLLDYLEINCGRNFMKLLFVFFFFIQHDNGYQITSAQKVRIRFWSLDSVESKGYVIALYKRATL
jgi:hypothetical protein